MRKIIVTVISLILFAICIKVTLDLFPKTKSDEEIKAKLTDEYILKSLSNSRTGDIQLSLNNYKQLVIRKKDKNKIHVTLNYVNKTKYSVWGDCYNYNITLLISNMNIDDEIRNLTVTGDVKTYYSGGCREAYMYNITYSIQ